MGDFENDCAGDGGFSAFFPDCWESCSAGTRFWYNLATEISLAESVFNCVSGEKSRG